MTRPALSILMPNYNHGHFLPESIGAMLLQSFEDFELLILDDASTDDSVSIIEGIARKDPRVRLIRNERNMGVEWSVNRLFGVAQGEYVYSPAADDRVLPGFFAKSIALLAQHPRAGLCSTIGCLITENGRDLGLRALPVVAGSPAYFDPEQVRALLVKYGRWIDAGSVIYRRSALQEEQGQLEELGSFADTFLNLLIVLKHGACYVPEPLHCWRRMKQSHSGRTWRDWRRYHSLGMEAAKLMETKYRDRFPPEFVDRFRRHWHYGTARVVCQAIDEKRMDQSELDAAIVTLCPGHVSRGFLKRVLRHLGTRHASILRLYMTARWGTWAWWIRGRLSILTNVRAIVLADGWQIRWANRH